MSIIFSIGLFMLGLNGGWSGSRSGSVRKWPVAGGGGRGMLQLWIHGRMTTASREVLLAIRQVAAADGRKGPARRPQGNAWSQAQSRPEAGPAQGAEEASAPRFLPPAHDPHPTGGACPGLLPGVRRRIGGRLGGGPGRSSTFRRFRPRPPSMSLCPHEQRRTPRADLAGVALGKQRLGINLVSLIAALREEARLP